MLFQMESVSIFQMFVNGKKKTIEELSAVFAVEGH